MLAHLEHDLFLLMLNLSQFRDDARIKQVFINSINSLEGEIDLRFLPDDETTDGEIIPVATAQNRFGRIAMSPNLDAETRALLRNSVQMLALILENRRHAALLADEALRLEDAVAERTRKLKRSVAALEQEVERRKYLEKELVESRRFLQRILDNTPHLLYLYDLEDRRNVYLNKVSSDLLGLGRPEIWERGSALFGDALHPEDARKAEAYEDRLKHLKEHETAERICRIREAEDRYRWLRTRDIPFSRSESGEVLLILGIAEDITEQKQAERERKILEERLRQSLKMEAIGTLTGGIAHDFNNILTIMLGNLELVMTDISEIHPLFPYLRQIESAGIRAKNVVRQLLNFSYQRTEDRKVVDLADVIQESLQLLRATTPADIRFDTDIAPDRHRVKANATEIHQILINLCTNAAHAMADGGRLRISLENATVSAGDLALFPDLVPGAYVRLTVSDTGCGIDGNHIERIFDPYFTTKDAGQGSGMGLAVVHGIVKGHGGAVRVTSKVGAGSRFDLFFPAVEDKLSGAPEAIPAVPGGTERILFVDDETAITRMTCQWLKRLGYRADGETDPVNALARLKNDPDAYDLLITDMTMPEMTGDRLASAVSAIRPDLPIILSTGFSRRLDDHRAAEWGVRKVVMKPLDLNQFATDLRDVLTHPGPPGQRPGP